MHYAGCPVKRKVSYDQRDRGGVMQLQAKDPTGCHHSQKLRGAGEFCAEFWREHGPANTLIVNC